MKTLHVLVRNQQFHIVTLNNHAESEPLTPRLARAALRVAHGHAYCTALVADRVRTYKLTPRTARRVR